MAYDQGLAERIREYFYEQPNVAEKKMFGGLCFMFGEHMCCGIVGDTLMARVGPNKYTECLTKVHTREMDFTGKAMKGMIYVLPAGIEEDHDLANWIECCVDFVSSLPPKKK